MHIAAQAVMCCLVLEIPVGLVHLLLALLNLALP